MPVKYLFNGHLFRLDCEGKFTADEVRNVFSKALIDPEFPEDAAFFVDITLADAVATGTSNQIRDVISLFGIRAEKYSNKFAISVNCDLFYGYKTIAKAFSEALNIKIRVFKTEKSALKWLGV